MFNEMNLHLQGNEVNLIKSKYDVSTFISELNPYKQAIVSYTNFRACLS
jgi:hypothetical protein